MFRTATPGVAESVEFKWPEPGRIGRIHSAHHARHPHVSPPPGEAQKGHGRRGTVGVPLWGDLSRGSTPITRRRESRRTAWGSAQVSQLSAITRMRVELPTLALLVVAAAAWLLTARMDAGLRSDSMMTPMTLGPFLIAWALMMAAMMLPAVTPVVRLYQRAAAAGRVAPIGYFVVAYLVVWALSGLPAYLLWRVMAMPLTDGASWALRLAGVALLFAGAYQLTPLKRACLRHCRSPMSYFLRLRGSLERPGGAFHAGLLHAAYCCGCCAALMVVLVAAAAMNLWWAVLIAVGVFIERNVQWGTSFSTGLGVLLVALGSAVVLHPPFLSNLI